MLVLVAGPSGAGKDTILNLARQALASDPRFRFVRRVITRPAEAGDEDHEAVSESGFAVRTFALQWQAHGLHYGIPLDITEDLARGIVVVANVSRGIIAEAAKRFSIRVVVVTASREILARRLAERGRETVDDIKKRLLRDVPVPDHYIDDIIVNDATQAEAADHLVTALIRAASPALPE